MIMIFSSLISSYLLSSSVRTYGMSYRFRTAYVRVTYCVRTAYTLRTAPTAPSLALGLRVHPFDVRALVGIPVVTLDAACSALK